MLLIDIGKTLKNIWELHKPLNTNGGKFENRGRGMLDIWITFLLIIISVLVVVDLMLVLWVILW